MRCVTYMLCNDMRMIHAMHVMHVMEHGVLHEDGMMTQFHDMCMQCEWHDVRCMCDR